MKPKRAFSLLLAVVMTLGLVPFAAFADGTVTRTMKLDVIEGESYAVWNEDILSSGVESNKISLTVTTGTEYDIVFPLNASSAAAYMHCSKAIDSWETADYIKPNTSGADGMLVWIKVYSGKAMLKIESTGSGLADKPLKPYEAQTSPLETAKAESLQSLECVLPEDCSLENITLMMGGTQGTELKRTVGADSNSYEYFRFDSDALKCEVYENGKKQTVISVPYDGSFSYDCSVYSYALLLFPAGVQQKNLGSVKTVAGCAFYAAPRIVSRGAQNAADWNEGHNINSPEPPPDEFLYCGFSVHGSLYSQTNAICLSKNPVTGGEGSDPASGGQGSSSVSATGKVLYVLDAGESWEAYEIHAAAPNNPYDPGWYDPGEFPDEFYYYSGSAYGRLPEELKAPGSGSGSDDLLKGVLPFTVLTVQKSDVTINIPDTASMFQSAKTLLCRFSNGKNVPAEDTYIATFNNGSWESASSSDPNSVSISQLVASGQGGDELSYPARYDPADLSRIYVSGGQSDRGLARVGDTVTLTASNKEGMTFVGWESVPELDFNKTDPTTSVVITGGGGDYQFIATFEKIKYPVNVSAAEGCVLTANAGEAFPGEKVRVTSGADTGYEILSVTASAGEEVSLTPVSGESGVYTFTMPASSVTVSAVTQKISYPVLTSAEYGSLAADVYGAGIGDTVTLTPSTQYIHRHLGLLTVRCGDDEIPTVDNGDGTYSFTMPAEYVYARAVYVGDCIVTFRNYNGAALEWGEYAVGETPVYSGETPAHPSSIASDYVFSGWDRQISAVGALDEEVTYTASFTAVPRSYTVTFYGAGGVTLQTGSVQYGETPVYTGETPVKAADGKYVYTFLRWTPEISPVNSDAEYRPVFTLTPVLHTGSNTLPLVRNDPLYCPFTPEETGYYTFRSSGDEVHPDCFVTDENGDSVEKMNYQFSYDGQLNFEFTSLLEAGKTYTVRMDTSYSDGTVSLSIKKVIMHTVYNDQNTEHGIVGDPGETSYMLPVGDYICPYVQGEWGYAPLDIILTDSNGKRLMEDDEGMYLMPDSDVTVTAVFAPAYGIEYDLTDWVVGFNPNRSVMFFRQGDYEDCAAGGAGVEYTFRWDEGYILDEFRVTTESGEEVPCGMYSPYMNVLEVWFEMPEEPVKVTLHVVGTYELIFAPGDGEGIVLKAAVAADSLVPLPDGMFTAPQGKEFSAWSVTVGDADPVTVGAGQKFAMTSDTTATATYRDVVPGDANSDGTVDSMDLTLLRQYLADPSTVIGKGADTDGSGAVDSLDLTRLRQYLADPTAVLGPQS